MAGIARYTTVLVGVMAAWLGAAPRPAVFHHVHFTSDAGTGTLDFYAGLFDAGVVQRFRLWGADALRTGKVLLLASPAEAAATPGPSAVWHYGWGGATLGETYLAHNLREVAWEPPLSPRTFHLHLESVTPNSAALWYRDHLGALVELGGDVEEPASRDLRRPRALVRFGAMAMLIYRSEQPLVSSRGKQVDHLAFEVADLAAALEDLAAADVVVLQAPHRIGDAMTALVEGPDRLAVELVEVGAGRDEPGGRGWGARAHLWTRRLMAAAAGAF